MAKTQSDYTPEQLNLVENIKRCKNFYEVLNVPKNASTSDIKKAYKKLALQLHPDKNRAPGAAEAFKIVGNAVTVLTDEIKRMEYDEATLHIRNGFNSSRHSFESSSFECRSDLSANDIFDMFFDGCPPSQRRFANGSTSEPQHSYHTYDQQENNSQPSLTFGLILVLIVISMLSTILTSNPVYSLMPSSKYPIKRETNYLSVPYYVQENFENEYKGSLTRLESSVEIDYIYKQKHNCYQESNYRKAMILRAQTFGDRTRLAQAQAIKMPSCDNLSKIKITRYSLY